MFTIRKLTPEKVYQNCHPYMTIFHICRPPPYIQNISQKFVLFKGADDEIGTLSTKCQTLPTKLEAMSTDIDLQITNLTNSMIMNPEMFPQHNLDEHHHAVLVENARPSIVAGTAM